MTNAHPDTDDVHTTETNHGAMMWGDASPDEWLTFDGDAVDVAWMA